MDPKKMSKQEKKESQWERLTSSRAREFMSKDEKTGKVRGDRGQGRNGAHTLGAGISTLYSGAGAPGISINCPGPITRATSSAVGPAS